MPVAEDVRSVEGRFAAWFAVANLAVTRSHGVFGESKEHVNESYSSMGKRGAAIYPELSSARTSAVTKKPANMQRPPPARGRRDKSN